MLKTQPTDGSAPLEFSSKFGSRLWMSPDEESDRRYPTAYLLHAYGDTAEGLVTPATHRQRWAPPIEDALDPVFGLMGLPPKIVVIPDGNSRHGCGHWVDSPVTGH